MFRPALWPTQLLIQWVSGVYGLFLGFYAVTCFRCFGGTYCLHLQSQVVLENPLFLDCLILIKRHQVPPKRQRLFITLRWHIPRSVTKYKPDISKNVISFINKHTQISNKLTPWCRVGFCLPICSKNVCAIYGNPSFRRILKVTIETYPELHQSG